MTDGDTWSAVAFGLYFLGMPIMDSIFQLGIGKIRTNSFQRVVGIIVWPVTSVFLVVFGAAKALPKRKNVANEFCKQYESRLRELWGMNWIEQAGAEAQIDGKVLLCMDGPLRPFVAEVSGPVDAAEAIKNICGNQYRELWGMASTDD